MFYGREIKRMDDWGRLHITKIVREKLGKTPVILKQGESIHLYPEEAVERFKPSQVILGKIDKRGYLCLSKRIAPFSFTVVIIGAGDHLVLRPQKKFSYNEITIKKTENLYCRGISVLCDGDKKEVRLKLV